MVGEKITNQTGTVAKMRLSEQCCALSTFMVSMLRTLSKGLLNSAALSLINVSYSSHGRPHNNAGYKLGILLHESIQVQVAIPFP